MRDRIEVAVVLSGGQGLRLKPITEDMPKGMIIIGGKPLLEWIIEWLRVNKIKNIVIGVAYKKEKITEYFGNGSGFGVNITYSEHTVEGGTAQGFLWAIKRYINDELFYAMNGDQITDLKLEDVANFHRRCNPTATLVGIHPRCPYGHIYYNTLDTVLEFSEKPICHFVYSNSGIYLFHRKILQYIPESGEIENTTFPLLAQRRELRLYKYDGLFLTINTLKELEEAKQELNRRGLA